MPEQCIVFILRQVFDTFILATQQSAVNDKLFFNLQSFKHSLNIHENIVPVKTKHDEYSREYWVCQNKT